MSGKTQSDISEPLTAEDAGTLKHIAAHAALSLIRNGSQMEDVCARLEAELRRVNALALTDIPGLCGTGRYRADFE